MASTPLPISELVKINDQNVADVEISDLLRDEPVLAAMPAVEASNGTLHKYNKLTAEPVVGFRSLNDGRDHDFTARTTVTETLQILDASFDMDAAIYNPELAALEGRSHLQSAFAKAERQIFYGSSSNGDSAGFNGLYDSADLNALADEMVIDGGGSSVGVQSSVYLIRATPDATGICSVFGNGGDIQIGGAYQSTIEGASGRYDAWVVPIISYMALQLGSKFSAARIANVESALDDDKIYEALSLFPASLQPTHICMNRSALKLLRASRTSTNATGAPAPRPTEVEGIPIVVSDQIVQTEAVVA